MKTLELLLLLLCTYASAQPVENATTSAPAENVTTTTPATTTTNDDDTKLLRQDVHVLPMGPRQRGRVILATTHVEGSDQWGVTAEDAETSCHRIAQINPTNFAKTLRRGISQRNVGKETENPLEGHLISVGSSYEVIALSRLLHPLPDGAFWTGGKIVRYRRHSMHDNSFTDHILLSWTDGRSADLSVLGMTNEDKLQLKESYIYCLALNLLDNSWQARDCSDKLPYACLVTPKRLRFSNQANIDQSQNQTSNSTKDEQSKSAKSEASGKLMLNTMDHEEVTTTPATSTSSVQTETTTAQITTSTAVAGKASNLLQAEEQTTTSSPETTAPTTQAVRNDSGEHETMTTEMPVTSPQPITDTAVPNETEPSEAPEEENTETEDEDNE